MAHAPSVRPDGDAIRLFDVHRDDGFVAGVCRPRWYPRHCNPPVQSVRPVHVARRPVHRDAVDRWRRSRQNDAQIKRSIHRQFHQESVEQPRGRLSSFNDYFKRLPGLDRFSAKVSKNTLEIVATERKSFFTPNQQRQTIKGNVNGSRK